MGESGKRVAHYLTVYVATDGVDAGYAEHLEQQEAQPIADLLQRQGGCPLWTLLGFPDQEPHRHQRHGHVVMPALPGAYLILVHSSRILSSSLNCSHFVGRTILRGRGISPR